MSEAAETFEIINTLGRHARAATKIVPTAWRLEPFVVCSFVGYTFAAS